jgi:hypothetical protein
LVEDKAAEQPAKHFAKNRAEEQFYILAPDQRLLVPSLPLRADGNAGKNHYLDAVWLYILDNT